MKFLDRTIQFLFPMTMTIDQFKKNGLDSTEKSSIVEEKPGLSQGESRRWLMMSHSIKDLRGVLPVHKTKKPKIRKSKQIDRIVVHTTASDNQDPFKLARYDITPSEDNHISKTGCVTITYADLILKDGLLYRCLDYSVISWHAGLYNTRSIGIAMMFKGQSEAPTPAQYNTLEEHLCVLCILFKLPPSSIIGHREVPGMYTILGNGSKKYKKECLLPGTHVLTVNGYKSIEEITTSDAVIGPLSSQHQRVLSTSNFEYSGEVITIHPKYDRFWPVSMTGDHLVLCWKGIKCNHYNPYRQKRHCNPLSCKAKDYLYRGVQCCGMDIDLETIEKSIEWVRADELTSNAYIALPIGKTNIKPKYSNEIAWLAGVYLAEGFRYQHDSVCICLSKKELSLARRVISIAEKNGYPCLLKDGRTSIIVIINNKFYQVVKDFVCGDRATNKYITQNVMNMPISYQDHFISGYFRGDGSEYPERLKFSTSSEMLAHQLFVLLIRAGFSPSKLLGRPHRECKIEGRTVQARQEFSVECTKQSGSTTIRTNEYYLFPIESLDTKYYSGKVYDITVENDACMFANSIVVHNCPGMFVNMDELRNKVCLRLQRTLSARGTYTGPIDGKFGKLSKAALDAFVPDPDVFKVALYTDTMVW